MNARAAILVEMGRPRPYAASVPLEVDEIELDDPQDREVRVRIASVGLCHSDLSTVDGTLAKPLPLVIGQEAAGTDEAIGRGVTQVAPGDRVVFSFVPVCGRCTPCATGRPALCRRGNPANLAGTLLRGARRFRRGGERLYHHLGVSGFSERTVCAEESLVRVPEDTPLEIAALFGCAALTGIGAVIHTAGVRPGTTVVIFGAGGVGLMALLGAVVAGAAQIVVVDPIGSKRERARTLGATATIDPAAGDPAAQVREHLGGVGADYAFEAVGSVQALEQAYAATGIGGTTVAVGLPRAVCRNILDPLYSDIGIGSVDAPVSGFASGPATWTQDFALPMGSSPPSSDQRPADGCPY